MNLDQRIETWLSDYARWRHAPPLELSVNSGATARTEVIGGEAVVCRPDGGMADFVQRHERALRLERTARAVEDALPYLPVMLRTVFEATYIGDRLEVPRSERDAAARMRVSQGKYQKLKFGLLCWFSGVNFQAVAVMQLQASVTTTTSTPKGRKAA